MKKDQIVKIVKTMSTLFPKGTVCKIRWVNERGDFCVVNESTGASESFGVAYKAHIKPLQRIDE